MKKCAWIIKIIIVSVIIFPATDLYSQQKDSLTIVFVTGDDEYRSREVLEPYAKMLRERYKFRMIYIKDFAPGGDLAPNKDPQPRDFPELEQIKQADLLVVFMRFRAWKPNSLKHFIDYFEAGKPAIGIRTTTHAFWRDRTFSPKYFGGHYKTHNTDHMVGQVNPDQAGHPIARGVQKKFHSAENGPYVSTPLSEGAVPIVLSYGHDRKVGTVGNDSYDSPTFPIAWEFSYKGGRRSMITLGNDRSNDHEWDVMLNLFYNSVFWSLGYEVPANGVLAEGDNFKMVKETKPYEAPVKQVPPPPAYTPEKGWEMLFDGTDLSKWKHWDVSIPPYGIPLDRRADSHGPIDYTLSPARWKVENYSAVARVGYGDIITKENFTNFQLRLDYYIPEQPEWAENEWRGNSGIFLNGSYEIAILSSHGKKATDRSNGAIYRMKAPDVEASKPEGEWQTLEVTFKNGKATVTLNGKLIHKEVKLDTPTFNGFPKVALYANESWQKKARVVSEGPLRLQSENSAVRFANIAIKRIR
jgi:hypothetical protein